MKRVILILVALPLAAWALLWIVAMAKERSVATRPWPNGLETLDRVPARYPDRAAPTPAAAALVQLTAPLGVDIEPREGRRPIAPRPPARKEFDAIKVPLHDYIDAQLGRPSAAIDEAPPALAAYFAAHRAQLDAVRAHLLAGAPIAWKTQLSRGFDAPIPNLLGHMAVTRLFVADALLKARSGDAAAWDDLHALWLLDGGLRPRPDLISQLIALACARMTNVAAAKLPLPEPAWLAEVRAVDYRRAIVASMQAEAWIWRASAKDGSIRPWLARPYIALCAADAGERMRAALTEMESSSACDVDSDALGHVVQRSMPRWNIFARLAIPNIAATWERAVRTTPELERTAKVLQLRRGETPSADSRCSDGRWLVTASSLKFSRPLRVAKSGITYPLEYAGLDLR